MRIVLSFCIAMLLLVTSADAGCHKKKDAMAGCGQPNIVPQAVPQALPSCQSATVMEAPPARCFSVFKQKTKIKGGYAGCS